MTEPMQQRKVKEQTGTILFLRPEDHQGLITMNEAIAAVEAGFRGWGQDEGLNAPRRRVHAPSGVRTSVHQGAAPALGATGLMIHCELVKIQGEEQLYHNRAHPTTVLIDAETADLRCIIIGEPSAKEIFASSTVALRTACTSAVGTKELARQDATRLGLLGSGGQAMNHLVAFCAIRPIKEVMVYSRNPENRRRFVEAMQDKVSAELRIVERPEDAVRGMDIVLCATNTNVPVFDGRWLEPGTHVTSIVGSNIGLVKGGFIPQKRREIDNTTIARSDVIVVCNRQQAIQDEQGDLFDPVQEGIITWDQVYELGELLVGKVRGRTRPEQITLFKNNAGQGVADVALGATIYRKALEQGLGLQLEVGPGPRH